MSQPLPLNPNPVTSSVAPGRLAGRRPGLRASRGSGARRCRPPRRARGRPAGRRAVGEDPAGVERAVAVAVFQERDPAELLRRGVLRAGQVRAGPLGHEQAAAVVELREERIADQRRPRDPLHDEARRRLERRHPRPGLRRLGGKGRTPGEQDDGDEGPTDRSGHRPRLQGSLRGIGIIGVKPPVEAQVKRTSV